MSDGDPFGLDRFVVAQDADGTYERALAEIRRGQKITHWMWFVFPQIAGLGQSSMARRYAISGLDEAVAYLAHPVLGPRLRTCAGAAASIAAGDVERAFGMTDAMKLRSSMTLFEVADPTDPVFGEVLDRHFAGTRDPATLTRLPSAIADDAAVVTHLAPASDPRWVEYFAADLTAPAFADSDAFDRWHALGYELGLVQSFDWREWSTRSDRPMDTSTVSTLTVADAVRVFTWICRSDRVDEGAIERALADGRLAALVGVVRRHIEA